MHRIIMNLFDRNLFIDHINHNGLDNRKCNLRIVTNRQNHMNSRSFKGTSKYKGIYWHKATTKWCSRIMFMREIIYLGEFNNEEEAAKMYDKKAIELFGNFAKLNFTRKDYK